MPSASRRWFPLPATAVLELAHHPGTGAWPPAGAAAVPGAGAFLELGIPPALRLSCCWRITWNRSLATCWCCSCACCWRITWNWIMATCWCCGCACCWRITWNWSLATCWCCSHLLLAHHLEQELGHLLVLRLCLLLAHHLEQEHWPPAGAAAVPAAGASPGTGAWPPAGAAAVPAAGASPGTGAWPPAGAAAVPAACIAWNWSLATCWCCGCTWSWRITWNSLDWGHLLVLRLCPAGASPGTGFWPPAGALAVPAAGASPGTGAWPPAGAAAVPAAGASPGTGAWPPAGAAAVPAAGASPGTGAWLPAGAAAVPAAGASPGTGAWPPAGAAVVPAAGASPGTGAWPPAGAAAVPLLAHYLECQRPLRLLRVLLSPFCRGSNRITVRIHSKSHHLELEMPASCGAAKELCLLPAHHLELDFKSTAGPGTARLVALEIGQLLTCCRRCGCACCWCCGCAGYRASCT